MYFFSCAFALERKKNIRKKACPFGYYYNTPKPCQFIAVNVPCMRRLCTVNMFYIPFQHKKTAAHLLERAAVFYNPIAWKYYSTPTTADCIMFNMIF